MATNEILRFAETDTGTNLLTQAEYLADSQRLIGNQPGVARSKLVNKALRQSSLIAAGIALFLADNQSNNITDGLTPQNIADYMATVVRSIGIPMAVAGGTANAITADFTPNVALTNGTTVIVRAGAANTTTTPTFAPDGLPAKTIVKGANTPLAAGDIAGAGHWLEMNFDAVLDKWVLQNPYASGLAVASTAEAQAQTDNTKAITPLRLKEALQGGNQNLAANGYQKLPGGLIIQWGHTLVATPLFPIAFPNACFTVVCNDSDATVSAVGITNVTTTQFTINGDGNFWIAIGY